MGKSMSRSLSKKPNLDTTVHNVLRETILMCPSGIPNYSNFMAIGKVLRVSRGEEADLLYCCFYPMAKGDIPKPRAVIVSGNHPRRQLLTVKRGQYAIVYGKATRRFNDFTLNDGRTVKQPRWEFYAYAIQGLYVPNAFDVKKAHQDKVDEELYTEMTESENKLLNDVIDDIFKNRGDEE